MFLYPNYNAFDNQPASLHSCGFASVCTLPAVGMLKGILRVSLRPGPHSVPESGSLARSWLALVIFASHGGNRNSVVEKSLNEFLEYLLVNSSPFERPMDYKCK